MAMLVGGSGPKAELNVTPLIDVLLVLLIIFMVISPTLSNGLDTLVPQPADQRASSPSDDILLTVSANGTVRIGQETVGVADLENRLKAIFKNTADHVVFVRGDKDLDFEQVADVIDIAKGV